jgi:pantothenate kinase
VEGPERVVVFADLVARARNLAAGRRRTLLGIAGSPGSGKTTLALALVRALAADPPDGLDAGWVGHVPMDGFHLADVELDRLGRRDRKGAPDTFDPAGYAALLLRLRGVPDGIVYAPAFDRDIEQPIAGSIPIHPECRLVVTEGNYLLLDDPLWRATRAELDAVWFVEADETLRLERLVARHVEFGKAPDAARRWVAATDEPNARLIEATRLRADLLIACADLPPRT